MFCSCPSASVVRAPCYTVPEDLGLESQLNFRWPFINAFVTLLAWHHARVSRLFVLTVSHCLPFVIAKRYGGPIRLFPRRRKSGGLWSILSADVHLVGEFLLSPLNRQTRVVLRPQFMTHDIWKPIASWRRRKQVTLPVLVTPTLFSLHCVPQHTPQVLPFMDRCAWEGWNTMSVVSNRRVPWSDH